MTAEYPAEDMARFDDRWTVRYVRMLPAPVSRVWEAVTQAEQLNIWFVPVVTLEPKLGGRCSFSWGQPESEGQVGTVTRFEPKKVFEISMKPDHSSFLRFELEPVDANTRFTFIDRFDREMRDDDLELAARNPDNKLLALPAGPDTPIRAGILEGYHLCFDVFPKFLSRDWAPGEIEKVSASLVAHANEQKIERFHNAQEPPSPLAELYFDFIRDECPPA